MEFVDGGLVVPILPAAVAGGFLFSAAVGIIPPARQRGSTQIEALRAHTPATGGRGLAHV